MLTVLMVAVDCFLRSFGEFCRSVDCCGDAGYCDCCTCGNDADVGVSGHTHCHHC